MAGGGETADGRALSHAGDGRLGCGRSRSATLSRRAQRDLVRRRTPLVPTELFARPVPHRAHYWQIYISHCPVWSLVF